MDHRTVVKKLLDSANDLGNQIRTIETLMARARNVVLMTTAERLSYFPSREGTICIDTDLDLVFVWGNDRWNKISQLMGGTTAERLAATPAFVGTPFFDTDTNLIYFWTGSGWNDKAQNNHYDLLLQAQGPRALFVTQLTGIFGRGYARSILNNAFLEVYGTIPATESYAEGLKNYFNYNGNIVSELTFLDSVDVDLSNDGFDILVWCKPNTNNNNNSGVVARWAVAEYVPSYGKSWCLRQYNDRFRFIVSDDGETEYYVETAAITNIENGWHLVVGSWRPGSSLSIYHNGAWVHKTTGLPTTTYKSVYQNYYIGAVYHRLTPSGGEIPFRFWNGKLSLFGVFDMNQDEVFIDKYYEVSRDIFGV